MYWIIDFESFKADRDDFVIKELSILSSDARQCYTYLIKPPAYQPVPSDNTTINYQYQRQRLAWNCGDFTLKEAMSDILKKIGYDNV